MFPLQEMTQRQSRAKVNNIAARPQKPRVGRVGSRNRDDEKAPLLLFFFFSVCVRRLQVSQRVRASGASRSLSEKSKTTTKKNVPALFAASDMLEKKMSRKMFIFFSTEPKAEVF